MERHDDESDDDHADRDDVVFTIGSNDFTAPSDRRYEIEMMCKNNRYARPFAVAVSAASATIGPIIPPSIPMVLYALVSGASVGALFIGGIVPGGRPGGGNRRKQGDAVPGERETGDDQHEPHP